MTIAAVDLDGSERALLVPDYLDVQLGHSVKEGLAEGVETQLAPLGCAHAVQSLASVCAVVPRRQCHKVILPQGNVMHRDDVLVQPEHIRS